MASAQRAYTLQVASAPRRLAGADFTYLGAFRLQEIWQSDMRTLDYSNGPTALLPNGRLLVGGHVYESKCMQFTIPATFSASRMLSSLPVAPQAGAWHALKPVGTEGFLMSMVVADDGYLYMQWSTDYGDLTNPRPTIARVPATTLSGVSPLFAVNGLSPFSYGRRITARGSLLYVGRHRGSFNGEGPNWYAIPQGPGPYTPTVMAQYLPWSGNPDGNPQTHGYGRDWVPSDVEQGMVWIETESKRALVMAGLKDWNPAGWYYGYENHVLPSQCEPFGTCVGHRGHRAGDARPTLLLWDADQLSGPVHQRYWYEKVDLSPYFFNRYGDAFLTTGVEAEGFCSVYDPALRRLYISESFADGARPVVHVFHVAG